MTSDRFEWGDSPAVIVVDVARSKGDPSVDVHDGPYQHVIDAVDHIEDLLSTARDTDVPVFFTLGGKSSHLSSGADLTDVERGGWLKQNELRDESPETAELHNTLVESLDRQDDEILIRKHGPSAFFKTMLDVYLSSLGIDTLVIAGLVASGCVRATVVDAFSYNYHVVLPRECVAESRPEVFDSHMDDMDRSYADVRSIEDATEYLRAVGD